MNKNDFKIICLLNLLIDMEINNGTSKYYYNNNNLLHFDITNKDDTFIINIYYKTIDGSRCLTFSLSNKQYVDIIIKQLTNEKFFITDGKGAVFKN